MDPVQQPGNLGRIPDGNRRIPAENNLRRDVKTFLETMRQQLDAVEPENLALPEMRRWREETLQAVKARNANISAILQHAMPFLQRRLEDPWHVEELFDRFVPEQMPTAPVFQEMALRRKCNHFVRDLGILLQSLDEPFTDQLTQDVKTLHSQFVQRLALQPQDTAAILNTFVPLFQALLVDPLFNPLEEDSLLGSDGETYGLMFLTIYYYGVPENRLAFSPKGSANFSAEDLHPVVRFLIQWLDTVPWQNGTAKPPERHRAEYEALAARLDDPDDLLVIPRRQDVAIRLLREELAVQEQVQIQQYVALNDHLQVILDQPLQQDIAELDARFQEMQVADHARLENLREHFNNQFAAAEERAGVLRQNADMLRERVEHLEAELNQLEGALNQADASIAQLNVAIAEVAQAIEDRKASAFGDVLKSIAIMGACIFASWAITMIIQNAMGVAAAGAGAAAGTGSGAAGVGAGAAKGAATFGINPLGPKALMTPIRGGYMFGLSAPIG